MNTLHRIAPKVFSIPMLSFSVPQYIYGLVTSWLIFFCFMTFYGYSYAFFVDENDNASLLESFQCVLKDWIVWILVSSLLVKKAVKQDISTRKGKSTCLYILLLCTVLAGSYRVVVEYLISGYSALNTAYIYFPRYIFASAFTLLVCALYLFKLQAEQKFKAYEKQLGQYQQNADAELDSLVVHKGQARVIIQTHDIISISANGNYLEIETMDDTYLLRCTMKNIEARLSMHCFVRIHRSHLVKLTELKSVCASKLEAKLLNGKVLRVGKTYLKLLPHFSGA